MLYRILKGKKNKSPLYKAGEMGQLIQCLKQEQEDLRSMPRIHPIKRLGMIHGYSCNPNIGEGKISKPLGLTGQPAWPTWQAPG